MFTLTIYLTIFRLKEILSMDGNIQGVNTIIENRGLNFVAFKTPDDIHQTETPCGIIFSCTGTNELQAHSSLKDCMGGILTILKNCTIGIPEYEIHNLSN